MATTASPVALAEGDGSVAIAAPVRGAMIVTGDNNTVEMRLSGVGAVLAFAFRWNRPRPRRRRDRRNACPPRFHHHVDREQQVASLLPVDGSPRAANVYGPAGIGKTYVLVAALRHGDSAMRHGTVYLDGRDQSAEDLLHAVFDELYECRVQRRDLRIERLLSSRRALIALEDVELPPDAAARLVLGAPRCRFLLTSRSRVLFDGAPVSLGGLPPQYAVDIAEQELGRALTAGEREAARSIAAALDGHPLALRQAFSCARDEMRTLAEMESQLVTRPSAATRLAALTAPQLRAARALAVHGDAALGDEHLRQIAGADAVTAAVELEARHDAISHSPRHSLVGVLAETLPREELALETERAVEHFVGWAEVHAGDTRALLREAGALTALLERAHSARRWREVVRLGRAIEGAFALGQRWSAWGRVLELVLDAALQEEDREAEGWARHQLGTRAFGMGQADEARASLERALALRERIGDAAGAAATRQNLSVVAGTGPLLYRLSHLSLAVVAILCVLLVGAGGVFGSQILPSGSRGPGQPEQAELVVVIHGTGSVVSDDGSLRCASAVCHERRERNDEVLLQARPKPGWEFARWSGACSGRNACRLVLRADSGVTARFHRVREAREVVVSVRGKGSVFSHPAGVACTGGDAGCRATFTRSRSIELTAAAAHGHSFTGWSGACVGTARCVISADEPRSAVRARFGVPVREAVDLALDIQGDGAGRVVSRPSGIDCGQLCSASFGQDDRVTLSAVAQPRSRFAGWSHGACERTGRTCTVTLAGSMRVVARFERSAPVPQSPPPSEPDAQHQLTVVVTGQGTVTSDPPGIEICAALCRAPFDEAEPVVLAATARPGSTFAGWGDGDCATGGDPRTCRLTLDRPTTVTARFEKVRGTTPRSVRRAPVVRILSPSSADAFAAGDSIRYVALARDPSDGRLASDSIVWREDGVVIGRGQIVTRAGAAPGRHQIEVTATNAARLSSTARISIVVVPRAPDVVTPLPQRAPVVRILNPKDGAAIAATNEDEISDFVDVQVDAQASDPDGDALTYRWTDAIGDGAPQTVSTVLSPKLRLRKPYGDCSAAHALTLSVSDAGATTTVTTTVSVTNGNCA